MLDVNQINHLLQEKVRQLQKQLKDAHHQIKSLREENQTLKQKLFRYQNQQSTYCLQSQGSNQVFTQSSQQEQQQFQPDYVNLQQEECQQIPKSKNFQTKIERNQSPELVIMTPLSTKMLEKTPPKIIFNYQSEGYHVPKVLQKNSKKQSCKQSSQNNNESYNSRKCQLSVQNSAIKNQSPIVIKTMSNTLFQRIRNSNKIYDTFFVTGYSFDVMGPKIQYYFPFQSKHFPVILSLIYTENSLRSFQNTQGKSPKLTNAKESGLSIKDSFVMILCKNENAQKQYLFACQVDDILQGPDHNLYVFNRMFCFITSCNFFSAYMKIIQHFINKINSSRQHEQLKSYISPIIQNNSKDQLSKLLEQNLKFLFQKNVNQNQSLSLSLGKQISIFIDVPSAMETYKSLLEYRPWGILFCPVYLSHEQQLKQKQLFGFLLIYMLTETKIMLYSMVKSKVSEAILHALQMIKPLQYVNPIIMATIKDQHQQYFNAPMSIILGLWGQPKQKRKQKIQIFMNKKPSFSNMSGLIEQNRMSNIDGVIFNLDTGYTFGGGLSNEKNKLAVELNYLIQNKCKSTKQQYKLLQNLLKGRIYLQIPQMRDLSDKIIKAISHTQLYSFFKQKNDAIFKL